MFLSKDVTKRTWLYLRPTETAQASKGTPLGGSNRKRSDHASTELATGQSRGKISLSWRPKIENPGFNEDMYKPASKRKGSTGKDSYSGSLIPVAEPEDPGDRERETKEALRGGRKQYS